MNTQSTQNRSSSFSLESHILFYRAHTKCSSSLSSFGLSEHTISTLNSIWRGKKKVYIVTHSLSSMLYFLSSSFARKQNAIWNLEHVFCALSFDSVVFVPFFFFHLAVPFPIQNVLHVQRKRLNTQRVLDDKHIPWTVHISNPFLSFINLCLCRYIRSKTSCYYHIYLVLFTSSVLCMRMAQRSMLINNNYYFPFGIWSAF